MTRRTFFKKAAGASVGTAVGALAALGTDLSPKVARAQELRIARAKVTPSVLLLLLGRVRPADPHG